MSLSSHLNITHLYRFELYLVGKLCDLFVILECVSAHMATATMFAFEYRTLELRSALFLCPELCHVCPPHKHKMDYTRSALIKKMDYNVLHISFAMTCL